MRLGDPLFSYLFIFVIDGQEVSLLTLEMSLLVVTKEGEMVGEENGSLTFVFLLMMIPSYFMR